MAEVVLCKDGMEVALVSNDGLWVVLREPMQDRLLGRFQIDANELLSTVRGHVSYQATNGKGSSVRFEGTTSGLKVRLDSEEHPSKQCRLEAEEVREALISLDIRV